MEGLPDACPFPNCAGLFHLNRGERCPHHACTQCAYSEGAVVRIRHQLMHWATPDDVTDGPMTLAMMVDMMIGGEQRCPYARNGVVERQQCPAIALGYKRSEWCKGSFIEDGEPHKICPPCYRYNMCTAVHTCNDPTCGGKHDKRCRNLVATTYTDALRHRMGLCADEVIEKCKRHAKCAGYLRPAKSKYCNACVKSGYVSCTACGRVGQYSATGAFFSTYLKNVCGYRGVCNACLGVKSHNGDVKRAATMLLWQTHSNMISERWVPFMYAEALYFHLNRSSYAKRERLEVKHSKNPMKKVLKKVRRYPLKEKDRMGELMYRCTLLAPELFEKIFLYVLKG